MALDWNPVPQTVSKLCGPLNKKAHGLRPVGFFVAGSRLSLLRSMLFGTGKCQTYRFDLGLGLRFDAVQTAWLRTRQQAGDAVTALRYPVDMETGRAEPFEAMMHRG